VGPEQYRPGRGPAGADIAAPEAWDLSTGSPDVIIAVIDTGVAYSHPDLAGNIWTNTVRLVVWTASITTARYIDDVT
jgi:subtilisin family serine protease